MNSDTRKRLRSVIAGKAAATSWTVNLTGGGTVTGTIDDTTGEVWTVTAGTTTHYVDASHVTALSA